MTGTTTTSIYKQPSTLLFASGKHPRKNNIMHNVFDHHNRKGRITNAMIINHAGWSASHEESVYQKFTIITTVLHPTVS